MAKESDKKRMIDRMRKKQIMTAESKLVHPGGIPHTVSKRSGSGPPDANRPQKVRLPSSQTPVESSIPLIEHEAITVYPGDNTTIIEATVPETKVAFIKRVGHSYQVDKLIFGLYYDNTKWKTWDYCIGTVTTPYKMEVPLKIYDKIKITCRNNYGIPQRIECRIDGWLTPISDL